MSKYTDCPICNKRVVARFLHLHQKRSNNCKDEAKVIEKVLDGKYKITNQFYKHKEIEKMFDSPPKSPKSPVYSDSEFDKSIFSPQKHLKEK
jgi:hypothetical protein